MTWCSASQKDLDPRGEDFHEVFQKLSRAVVRDISLLVEQRCGASYISLRPPTGPALARYPGLPPSRCGLLIPNLGISRLSATVAARGTAKIERRHMR
jgi:hypothetical protein